MGPCRMPADPRRRRHGSRLTRVLGMDMAVIDIDLKKLKRDVAKRQASRPAGMAPGGRRATGSMAVVRQHLPQFDALRAAGASWSEIAAGLAGQGVTQGEGQEPITAKRLTALVTLVRKAEAKRAAAIVERAARPDAPPRPAPAPLTLSVELIPHKPDGDVRAAPSEESHRHAALARSKALLKDT